jgi:small Trp-rich protein
MAFLLTGLLLLALKLLGVAPVAEWGWLWVLSPFAMAVAWWAFVDASGMTQRRAMQRMEDRKAARRQKAIDALQMASPRERAEAASRRMGGHSSAGADSVSSRFQDSRQELRR